MSRMSNKKKKQTQTKDEIRLIATNRRAKYEYSVEEIHETGIALSGTEVKSIRGGGLNFADAFASIIDDEIWLINLHIDEYEQGNRQNHLPSRKRKLLMHKKEIEKLKIKTRQDGYTLIPLRFYFKKSWIKVEIGLCRGKKDYDKRQSIAKRDAKRQIARAMANNLKR